MSTQLTDRQLKLAINSTHERAMILLDMWCGANQKTFRKPDGQIPTKEELDALHESHMEHLELVDTLRRIRTERGKA